MNQSDSEWSVAQILEPSAKLDPVVRFQFPYKLIVQAHSPSRPSHGGGRDG